MPTWSSTPPPTDPSSAFTLLRTPSDRPLVAIVTSDDLIGCQTHYWGGRTVPCESVKDPLANTDDASNCPACQDFQPKRWHGYLSAYNHATRNHFLFEFTARGAVAFEQYRLAHGTLRGCCFEASRPKPGRNTRVEIVTKPIDLNKYAIPKAPNLIRAMSVIWQLPATAVHTRPDDPKAHDAELAPATMARMRGKLDTPDSGVITQDIPHILDPETAAERAGNGRQRRRPTQTDPT
jgi:hypothetical protein